ncbi:MAG: hypothetical protein ACREIR_00840 [Geminicoccaceae bacterium]
MMPEVAVAFATFVIVLLVLNRWTREDTEVAFSDDEDTVTARRFIATKIDEHVEALAKSYLEAGGDEADGDEVPPRFAQDIEAFIATALMRDSADLIGLGAAVRGVVTLERERIYALVLARVQAHRRAA